MLWKHNEKVLLYDIFHKMLSKHYKHSDPESQKKIDRNYSMHFTDQKTETGVWETLPPLKGINIGQVSINGNKKAENLKN